MKTYESIPFTDKIRWRIRLLRLTAIAMLVYMIVIGELGGGDSRMMTPLATNVSNFIFFGGFFYVLHRIRVNKKLLINPFKLEQQMLQELDERNRYLHDKSGGIVLDILLLILLFTTVTAAMFNMAAFYTAVSITGAAIALKLGVFGIVSRCNSLG